VLTARWNGPVINAPLASEFEAPLTDGGVVVKQSLLAVWNWCEARLHLAELVMPVLNHPVPRGLATRAGWWYVFGSMTLTMFVIQIVTGICLALVYVPSAGEAYESLEYLNYHQPFGWFMRALHNWAASGMVIMMVIHMAQVFLWGAYKYPRELTWLVGVVLFALTLGMAFTGQILRWDEDAYWGVAVAGTGAGHLPVVGPYLTRLILGGPTIGGDTLSRFFTLHVFIIPGILILCLAAHLHLVLKKGVSEPPQPGKPVDPKTYDAEYHKELEKGIPFFPEPIWRDAIACALGVVAVVIFSAIVGPYGPKAPPDPSLIPANPRPDWYFLPLFTVLSLCPAELETPVMFGLPAVLFGVLILLPFIDRRGERAPSRRPIAVLTVIVLTVLFFAGLLVGIHAPWSPHMYAWSGEPVPVELLEGRSPLQLQGAAVLQAKNCRNCHALNGSGGHRGPDLGDVGTRLTRDQLIRQVIQGSEGMGDMPAYGKQLNPEEVDALAAYMGTLRPRGQAAARPAAD
jgi:ubiquinol-cytochrome c reductase cytochrome b subunit